MSATAIALGLAKFVPDIVGWIAGDKAEKVASKVVGIAEDLTGQRGDEAMKAINQDPHLALEFHKAVMADKHRFDEMVLADRQSAREAYKVHNEASDKIAFIIMRFNLPLVFLLVVADVLACIYLGENAAVLTTVSTTVGFVINALLKERQDVTGFHFGSSLGSKMKTAAMGGKQPNAG